MAVYRPAFGLKGRTFELWVLNRWALISASAVPHYGAIYVYREQVGLDIRE